MGASNEAKLIITGDPTGAKKAIDDVSRAYKDAAAQMGGAFAPLSAGISTFGAAMASLGALLAGGAMFKASISAANEWNSQVQQISKAMGTTTEQASVMAVALNHLGISSDTVSAASLAMSRQLGKNEEAFTALGVQTRDLTTGQMLPAGEIMAAVNTKLAGMKNGVEQNIAGMAIYGKGWGDFRSIVKLTTEVMDEAAKRAKELNLIIGPEGVASTRAYKESQNDIKLIAQSLEIQIGEKLLPTMVKLGAWMAGEGPIMGRTFGLILDTVIFSAQSLWLALKDMGDSLGAMAAQAAALLQGNLQAFRAIGEARDEEAKKNADAYEKLKENFGKPLAAEESTAAKRVRLQSDLQATLAKLEHLRAVAAGEADAIILEDDDKQTKSRIKNAEKLRDALRQAWQQNLEASKTATTEAATLLEKAAGTRGSAADKAAEIRRSLLPQQEQVQANQTDFNNLSQSATESALLAKIAAQQGRIAEAAKLADQASKDAERAQKFADKLIDPNQQAAGFERIADAQATADEARAAIKQQQAKELDQTAAKQAVMLNDLDKQITDLQNKAANITITAQIDEALANIQTLQAQLDTLQDKTVTVTVNTVQNGTPAAAPNSFSSDSSMTGFARGGFTGLGGKYQAAGIVHAGEVVINQDVVKQRGMLALLLDINRRGLAALPGFASGGLVGNLNLSSVRPQAQASPSSTAVFNFPDLGRYQVSMMDDAFAKLQVNFQRIALQKGGRR